MSLLKYADGAVLGGADRRRCWRSSRLSFGSSSARCFRKLGDEQVALYLEEHEQIAQGHA